ncbi:MAG: class I SAM-dependent methyltransferase [Gammaproteobacteria bacterium]|nr:class I SAM-dependent methyltransferase [Gammaproteobacteria bacterium]MDP2346601.1 class I SAM-dependent methyltransferase [Gammaproteobacteria bacterium]
MNPADIAKGYDQLAERWASDVFPKDNGIAQHERALAFVKNKGRALDIGCGGSGRVLALLLERGFDEANVEGVDISERMLLLARQRHPQITFHQADICAWPLPQTYDFISAWDSIWHIPLSEQRQVLQRIMQALNPGGVFIFTTGGVDEPSEKTDSFMGPTMYYSVLGIPETLELITRCGCVCRHLEYDQHPELHVYLVVQKI